MGSVKVMLTKGIGDHHKHVWQGEAVFPGRTDLATIVANLAFDNEGSLQLAHEAQIYQYLMPNYPQNPSGLPLPIFYG